MTWFVRAVAALSTAAGVLAAAMVLISVFVVCHMVFVRYALGHSTIWQTEFVTYLLIGAVFVGSPFCLLTNGHVYVDLLPRLAGARTRQGMALLSALVTLAFAGLLFWLSVELWLEAWHGGWRSETVWAVDLWKAYAAMPVGLGLLCLQVLADIAALAGGSKAPFGLAEDALR
jgi:TRAP-type C4-dicarboxylate transport system permease small subunit